MGDKKDKKVRRVALDIAALLLAAAVGATLLLVANQFSNGSSDLKDYFFLHGIRETGSVNLVSAIYLGYRAFDTLGEAIVLLITVTGVAVIMGGKR